MIPSGPMNASFDGNLQSGGTPPVLPAQPKPRTGSARQLFAILLSLCLAFFLVDAAVSVIDDSVILLSGLHALSALRGLISFFAFLMALGVYGLIGLTPMVPKRLFLPIPAFALVSLLCVLPFAI
jgi:hypothetical protein